MKTNSLWTLVGGQFFSALADNMAIFLVSAVIIRKGHPEWYIPLAMGIYFAVYVLVSPWAGNIGERVSKRWIFIGANFLKMLFFIAILLDWNPAWSYSLFGLGAVLYSPAKYGILPFICPSEKSLLHGNAMVEGSTIISIILGTVVGGGLTDYSLFLAVLAGLGLLVIGNIISFFLPDTPVKEISVFKSGLGNFWEDAKFFLTHREGGAFSVFGSVVFWMGTRTLQTMLFAWVPFVFGLEGNTPVGILTGVTAVGTIVGALLAPHVISYRQGSRLIGIGVAMGIGIIAMSVITHIYILGGVLFVVGLLGGLFLIPVNSLNEHIGEHRMGASRAVEVQNFMENLFSSGVLLLYTFFAEQGASPRVLVWSAGIIFILLMLALWPYRTQEHMIE